jgi:putative hydrolase of the HAD superfamily
MITTIAFDYGNVLVRPAENGTLPPALKELLGMGNLLKFMAAASQLPALMEQAKAWMEQRACPRTEEEEFAMFREFYALIFNGVGITKNADALCETVAQHTLQNAGKAELYEDVLPQLTVAKERFRIAAVSETLPSFKQHLMESTLFPLLDFAVLSCDYGLRKEEYARLLELAVTEHGVVPAETLLVEDSAEKLDIAKARGFACVLMNRNNAMEAADYPIVYDLADVLEWAGEL